MSDISADASDQDAARSSADRTKAAGILLASAAAAGSAFVIQWLVGRFSAPELTAEFLVFWSLLFGVFGVVGGMQNETTRAVGSERRKRAGGARALVAALVVGAAACLVVLVSSPLWTQRLVPSTSPTIVVVIGAAVILYACHVTLSGALSGRESWNPFSGLMAAEAAVRLILVAVVLLTAGGLFALEVGVALGALTWLGFLLFSTESRRAAAARTDVPLRRLLRNHGYAIASSASSAALITGFPVLLQLTSQDADAAVLASTILAISLTRSPIMIPLQAFQGVAITAFLRSERGSLSALARPMAALAGLGAIGAVAAALLGPWLMDVLFAGKYDVAAGTFAGLMIAAATLAMLTLTGTATIAMNAHVGYTAGWILASVTALGLLLVPLPLTFRAVLALIVGPLVGLLVHVGTIALAGRTRIAPTVDSRQDAR